MQLVAQQVLAEPQVDSPEAKLQENFKDFLESFKDPIYGFVYKNKLQAPYDDVVKIGLEDLPANLYLELQKEPFKVRELFIKTAQEYAGRPARVWFVSTQQHAALQSSQLSASNLEKLVTVKGLLIGSSKTRPKTKKLVAVCRSCRDEYVRNLPFGVNQISLPTACQRVRGPTEAKCPPGSYVIAAQQCGYVDCQNMRLQDDSRNQLSIYLESDLVDQDLIAGQHLLVTGVLKQTGLVAFGYEPLKNENKASQNYQEFLKFAGSNPLQKLQERIAPHLHGLDSLKLALACQQVSGTSKITAEKTRLRGEINVLILADPGVGKSELLKAAQLLNKISVQTSGRGTSAAGLTAAVIRDSATGEFMLEGGALVLADGGILCIDEFDKCRQEDVVALHEAMEQGTISVNKAGVQSVLSTRVSVLAAANPSFGRYDELQGLSEQVDLQATIASRFDLIFFLRDVVDFDRDNLVVEKVGHNLMDGIQKQMADNYSFLRSYFEECKKINTTLSEEAGNYLRDFYIKLRRLESNLTVTVRQLEALIRLSESIAKLHMRQTVLLSDAEKAVELYKSSTGDAAAVGLQETLGKVSSLQVAEAQRLLKEKMPMKVPKNEVQLINELKQIGLTEGAAGRAMNLLIGNGEVQRGRGRVVMRVK
ncbi:DNA_replication licensing factor MCM5 [Hexamita inflata]|uniref:DNA helicase n=1 Tax=Hexamita inflata TaxID=28002 RepID=A0ABP1GEV2_9EUKA